MFCSVINLWGFIVCPNPDDVVKWKHFPRYWPLVRGIYRSAVNSPHKGQWRGALIFSLICAWTNGWINIRDAGDLRRNGAHHDVTVMIVYYVLVYDDEYLKKYASKTWPEELLTLHVWFPRKPKYETQNYKLSKLTETYHSSPFKILQIYTVP